MITRINYSVLGVCAFVTLTIIFSILAHILPMQVAHAQGAPTTVTFELEKKFSGPVPTGYFANQFSFNISGILGPISLTTFNPDSANGTVALPVGVYTLSENGPVGFVPADWTVQWSGAGCQDLTVFLQPSR